MTESLQENGCVECGGTGLVGTVNKHTCKKCNGTGKVYTEGTDEKETQSDSNDGGGADSTTDAAKGPEDGIVARILRAFGFRFAL